MMDSLEWTVAKCVVLVQVKEWVVAKCVVVGQVKKWAVAKCGFGAGGGVGCC